MSTDIRNFTVRAFSPADLERKDYDTLYEQVVTALDADMLLRAARAVGRFLRTEPNPAYGDSLVTLLLSAGHDTVLALLDEPPTYGTMMIKRVSTTVLRIQEEYRGILEAHNTEHQE